MQAEESLVLVGGSVRAAAFSALRAGLRPWCADLFADLDLRQRCPTVRIPPEHYPPGLHAALALAPPGPWVYTGALENRPALLRRLAAVRPLWGNGGAVLKRARSPFALQQLLREHGLPCPRILRPGSGVGGGTWLRKPRAGAGGRGIVVWQQADATPTDPRHYYLQEFVEGQSCAAIYVGDDRGARMLGVTRQLVGELWLHAAPFHYCGSVGPLALTAAVRERFARLGDVLAKGLSLRGLFGVDCVLRDGQPWPVEVNPRYTASVEVLEYATGVAALALHRAAFDAAADNPGDTPAVPGVVGKAVVFAPAAFIFPEDGPWQDTLSRPPPVTRLPAFADIPAAGQEFAAGWPVLTCFARAATEALCLEKLRETARTLDRRLFCL